MIKKVSNILAEHIGFIFRKSSNGHRAAAEIDMLLVSIERKKERVCKTVNNIERIVNSGS